MKATTQIDDTSLTASEEPVVADQRLPRLLSGPARSIAEHSLGGVVVGDLVGMKDDGRTPLVLFAGQPGTAAVAARSVVDLFRDHVGRQVALMFEGADAAKPIVVGVLREGDSWPLGQLPGHAEVEADGERLIVDARRQLVLRCGRASITLTREGKVLIQGTFLSSRSSGVNRIRGASVQIN
jgi:hypothetical protein